MATEKKFYTGEKLKERFPKEATARDVQLHPYFPDEDLVKAVNIAIMLERPLLVMGEPGCGKSLLAHALAFELYQGEEINSVAQNYKDWLFEWNIKSTSKAKEGFYEYEALSRLLDVQMAVSSKVAKLKAGDTNNYIKKRAMANAITKSTETHRAILLIDEIDKADPDFPNDLLNELESGKHVVTETGKPIVENPKKPIIIITSNREKDLPDAFLRRCVYYFIPPFNYGRMVNILKYRFYEVSKLEIDADSSLLIDKAVEAYEKARKRIEDNKTSSKKISMSELIDWFQAIKKTTELSGNTPKVADFVKEIQEFIDDKQKFLPLQQALFKNYEMAKIFEKEVKTDK